MKAFFQLISVETGVRSPAFGCERTDAAKTLLQWCIGQGGQAADSHYVLVLVEDLSDMDWQFSTAPLMTVRRFIENFSSENGASK